MYRTLELIGLVDALEKRAEADASEASDKNKGTLWDSIVQTTAMHPYLIPGLAGAALGGGVGAMFSTPDAQGQTHRGRNALIGALAGGGLGTGAGALFRDQLENAGLASALKTDNKRVAHSLTWNGHFNPLVNGKVDPEKLKRSNEDILAAASKAGLKENPYTAEDWEYINKERQAVIEAAKSQGIDID